MITEPPILTEPPREASQPEVEARFAPPGRKRRRKLRPLSLSVRITLHVLGWLMVAIGVAGFFLPVLPGGLALALGLALLSVASRRLHQWLRPKFRRWPKGWRRLENFRRRLHRRLEPRE